MSALDWKPVEGVPSKVGGQGTVVKVRHVDTGIVGAMKTLHVQHATSHERRYRMQQEVNALKLFTGNGTPRVLEDNSKDWEEIGTTLYAVLEWIDGPTLADFVSGKPLSLNDALRAVTKIAEIVDRCHEEGLQHRDIKPDNIILRHGDVGDPCLVDFGMVWSRAEDRDFKTDNGQELGNRFLRLPEFAPGQHRNDVRSDVTFVAGVLFYLITGHAPRVLQDPDGRFPHELATIPSAVAQDPRWDKLRRVFNIAFQPSIQMRFPSAREFEDALGRLDPDRAAKDRVAHAQERIRDVLDSSSSKALAQIESAARLALVAFQSHFISQASGAGFEVGGSGPSTSMVNRHATVRFHIVRRGTNEPIVPFVHRIKFEGARFESSYSLDGASDCVIYYTGLVADSESLAEAAVREVRPLLGELLDRYAEKLRDHLEFPAVAALRISRNAAHIGSFLSLKSKHALEWDPQLIFRDLREELKIELPDASAALAELKGRGYVDLPTGVKDDGIVAATKELFLAFDQFAKGWNPAEDAVRVAQLVSQSEPRTSLRLSDLEASLGWSARRLNPAVLYLIRHHAIEASQERSSQYITPSIMANEGTLPFLQGG